MKGFLALLTLVLFSCAPSTPARQSDPPPLVLAHVTIIDVARGTQQADMTVVVNGNRITLVGRAGRARIPRSAVVVDATGKFLIPGLWDSHIHLTIIPDQEVSRDIVVPLLIANGVTSVRDMGGDWERLQSLRHAITAGKVVGPRIVTPGPFVDGPQEASKFLVPVKTEEEARLAVGRLKAQGVDFIKVQAALTTPLWRAVLDEAGRLGIPVAGHVPERISAFEVAKSTQRSIEHISPVLPGDAGVLLACSGKEADLRAEMLEIEHLAEQPDADRPALRGRQRALQSQMVSTTDEKKCGQLFSLLRTNGIVAVPTQVFGRQFAPHNAGDLVGGEAFRYLPHSTATRWQNRRDAIVKASAEPDFEFRKMLFGKSLAMVGAMHRAGVTLLAGTDAMDFYVVPGFSLHQELTLMVQAGLTPLEALQTATINPARFHGKEKDLGTIATGKLADLVLLEDNPLSDIHNTQKISAVIRDGRLLDRRALDELLKKIEAAANRK